MRCNGCYPVSRKHFSYLLCFYDTSESHLACSRYWEHIPFNSPYATHEWQSHSQQKRGTIWLSHRKMPVGLWSFYMQFKCIYCLILILVAPLSFLQRQNCNIHWDTGIVSSKGKHSCNNSSLTNKLKHSCQFHILVMGTSHIILVCQLLH